jgi:hypothetical protein
MTQRFFCTSIFLLCSVLIVHAQTTEQQPVVPTVLIELFSSEGCSSCPMADQFLQELLVIADSVQAPVFCLDYHVDIWNKSGWVDRFSDTSFSRRQREYMVKNKQQALFTPMIFVNGGGALPGNAKKEVSKAINEHMKKRPVASLVTKAGYIPETNTMILEYEIAGNIDSCSLQLVLAYKKMESKVTAGENAGQTLVHHHTAKQWEEIPLNGKSSGKVKIQLPAGEPLSNFMLISFVQHQPTWQVYSTDQLMFR